MQPSKPSTRTLAIVGLLVVGIVCSFAFHRKVKADAPRLDLGEEADN